jgi:cytidylate kinase
MNYHALSVSVAEGLLRAQSAAREHKEPPLAASEVRLRCTIGISREAGAGGTSVAVEVGRRLGCPVYDREVLDKVGEELGQPTFRLADFDERPVTWLEESLATLPGGKLITYNTYIKHLVATVRGLGLQGRCVLVGRGCCFILPPQTTLRVRLVGEVADRVKAARQRFGFSEREASTWVVRTEQERALFVKNNFHGDVTDPHQFDLVLNTSRLSVSECADVIVQAFLRFEGRAHSVG